MSRRSHKPRAGATETHDPGSGNVQGRVDAENAPEWLLGALAAILRTVANRGACCYRRRVRPVAVAGVTTCPRDAQTSGGVAPSCEAAMSDPIVPSPRDPSNIPDPRDVRDVYMAVVGTD